MSLRSNHTGGDSVMEKKWPVNASIRKWDMPQVVYMTSGTYVSTQCWWTQRVALGCVLAVLPEAQGVPGGPLPPRPGSRVLERAQLGVDGVSSGGQCVWGWRFGRTTSPEASGLWQRVS